MKTFACGRRSVLSVVLGVLCAGVFAGGLVLPGGRAAAGEAPAITPGSAESQSTYQLPYGTVRRYHRAEAVDLVPAPLAALRARTGDFWEVAWNETHATPQLVVPFEKVTVAVEEMLSGADGYAGLVASLRDFVDANADFLGVRAAGLGEPFVYAVRDHRVVVFPQVTDLGMEVRGANLRAVVRGDGSLGWIKAYLLRAVEHPETVLLDEPSARAIAAAHAERVDGALLQLGFPGEDAQATRAVWVLDALLPEGWRGVLLLDAETGDLLERFSTVEFFDPDGVDEGGAGAGLFTVRGSVGGQVADPANAELFSEFLLRGAMVHEAVHEAPGLPDSRGRVLGRTEDSGRFEFVVPAAEPSLRAELESWHCLDRTREEKFDEVSCFPAEAEDDPSIYPVFRVEPLAELSVLPPDPLDPPAPAVVPAELDADSDGVPDLVLTQSASEPFDFRFNSDPAGALDADERARRGFWVSAFEGAYVAELAQYTLDRIGLLENESRFFPLPCLIAAPLPQEVAANGLLASGFFAPHPECRSILATPRLRSRVSGELEPTTGSLVAHEVAHGVYAQITNTALTSPRFRDVEEGVVDALTGMGRDRSKVGYHTLAEDGARSDAFDLASLDDAFRSPTRKRVGNAFWALYDALVVRDRDRREDIIHPLTSRASDITLLWLALNRLADPLGAQRFHTPEQNIYLELLLADDLLEGGDGDPSNGTRSLREIIDAFSGVRLFDAAFIRADADGNGRVELADALNIANFLFLEGAPDLRFCPNALDGNNDGLVDITDVIVILNYLYLANDVIPPPRTCGFDLEPPGTVEHLGCFENSACSPRF